MECWKKQGGDCMKKISKGPKVSYSELMKKVNEIKGNANPYRIVLTKEQKDFLILCREKKIPALSFVQAAELWNSVDGWKTMSPESLRNYYEKIKKGNL